jgi:imidazole glycerol-phosphate synthase subunit HisF
MVLDIDATAERREPDLRLIQKLASECRMPLCYGGGIRTATEVDSIIGLGVEKVAVGAALVQVPKLLSEAAQRAGRQSLVAVLDVRQRDGRYEVFIENGRTATGLEPAEFARRCADEGAGELVINAIDRDGTMRGYDLGLVESVRDAVRIPITALGGAGSLQHVAELVRRFGTIGAAAGSLFVFKGSYRAVLINYPRPDEKAKLMQLAGREG